MTTLAADRFFSKTPPPLDWDPAVSEEVLPSIV